MQFWALNAAPPTVLSSTTPHANSKTISTPGLATLTTTPCESGGPVAGDKILDIFKISTDGKTLQIGGGSNSRPAKLAPAKYAKQ